MNLKLPQLLALTVGATLIYAAIKGVSPVDVLKAGLKGQSVTSGPTAPTGNAPGGGTATVDGNGNPTGGQITPGGQYLPPTDQTQPQPHAPGSGTVTQEAYRAPYTVVSV